MPSSPFIKQPSSVVHDLTVEINGVDTSFYSTVERVDISLRQNEHDLATITVGGMSELGVTRYMNLPIRIRVNVPYSEGFTFVGYITQITPTHKVSSGKANDSLLQEATLHCLGASSVMRGKKNKIWSDFNVLGMVKELSQLYSFSYSCPEASSCPNIPRLAQRGMSDWEALTKAAINSGLAVNVHGTHIHVWKPDNARQYGAPTGTLTSVSSTAATSFEGPGRIIEFDGKFGSAHAFGDVNVTEATVLDINGNLVTVKDSEISTNKYGTPIVSTVSDSIAIEAISQEDLTRRLGAINSYSDAFIAEATTTGVAGPLPGSAIGVDGFSSEFDGMWTVRAVNLKFNRGHFVTHWEITRSSLGRTLPKGVSINYAYTPAPAPKMVNNKWKTTLRKTYEYATS